MKYETKLKLGRKLEEVDAATASDNQVSVLFRYDDAGADKHISFSVESDIMTADDIIAVLGLLESRGVFTKVNSKTWVSQPQASEAKFGATRTWKGVDIERMASQISAFFTPQGADPSPASPGIDALGRLREAERRLADMERALKGLRDALAGKTDSLIP